MLTWSVRCVKEKEHLKPNIEKIGVTEWLPVKQHSRMVYLKLRPEDVRIYDLQQYDSILVKLIAVKKCARDDSEKEGLE